MQIRRASIDINLKANSERNGAFSGDSSTNSKSFEGKVHLHRSSLSDSKDVAKVQRKSETTKDKGQKRALERESRVRQSLMEGKLLWKRAEIASDYSDLNQGLYKQPGMLSEPAVQVRVHPQSDLSTAKIQQNSEITKLSSKKELPPVLPLGTNRRGISKAVRGA